MKLSTVTLILASLASSIAALPLGQGSGAGALAARGEGVDYDDSAAYLEDRGLSKPAGGKPAGGKPAAGGSGGSDGAIPPAPPTTVDPVKVQVWLRLNTGMMDIAPKKEGHNDHAELIRNTKDAGGQHTDVVVGNAAGGFTAYGLEFATADWVKKNNNGNGAATHIYVERAAAVDPGPATWVYQGVVKDGRIKKGDSAVLKTKAESFGGKLYDVNTWNCRAFSTEFVKAII